MEIDCFYQGSSVFTKTKRTEEMLTTQFERELFLILVGLGIALFFVLRSQSSRSQRNTNATSLFHQAPGRMQEHECVSQIPRVCYSKMT